MAFRLRADVSDSSTAVGDSDIGTDQDTEVCKETSSDTSYEFADKQQKKNIN